MRLRLHGTSPSAMFPGVLPPSLGGILRQTPAGTVPGITEDTRFYIPKKNMAEPDLLIKTTQRKGHGTEEMQAD